MFSTAGFVDVPWGCHACRKWIGLAELESKHSEGPEACTHNSKAPGPSRGANQPISLKPQG